MYQLKNLLCPTDFSAASLEAIRIASQVAERYRAMLTLLYVNEDVLSPYWTIAVSPEERAVQEANVERFAFDQLHTAARSLGLNGDSYKCLVRHGIGYKEIIQEAEHQSYEVIVLSTSGVESTSPHLLGRTTERIIRLSRVPILTIRPPFPTSEWKIERILCPTDFSEYGNYALPYAISMALRYSAQLVLLHITGLTVSEPERLHASFPDLQLYHQKASTIRVERLIDRDIEPENSIVRIAREHDIGLIVMGTHGARGIRRVQIGNTTEEVIRRVDVPVLSVTHPIHKVVFPYRFIEEYRGKPPLATTDKDT